MPFGRVHYENETGEIRFRRMRRSDEATYKAEIEAGSNWVEAASGEFRNLWGERL